MSWNNNNIMDRLQFELKNNKIDHEIRRKIYIGMIKALEENDWDSGDYYPEMSDEDDDLALFEAFKQLYPSWFEENEE